MKVLTNIEEVGTHHRALAELDALGDQDNSAWACVHRIVQITDEHWLLQESTNSEDLDAFNDWNWNEHHYGVEYRSAWSSQPVVEFGQTYTGDHWLVSDAGVEARITLAGGGPAVRIVAELDGYGSTDKFIVEHANWSNWEAIDFYFADRLSDDVRNYVLTMVERYIQQVAGWIQEF
tara:strand:- start:245 stop:775 length:531 start_codon:yes stop_codon:yes gene_type:complete